MNLIDEAEFSNLKVCEFLFAAWTEDLEGQAWLLSEIEYNH